MKSGECFHLLLLDPHNRSLFMGVATHSGQQDFYFGTGFFRWHDYHVEASGGFAQLPFDDCLCNLQTTSRALPAQPCMTASNATASAV